MKGPIGRGLSDGRRPADCCNSDVAARQWKGDGLRKVQKLRAPIHPQQPVLRKWPVGSYAFLLLLGERVDQLYLRTNASLILVDEDSRFRCGLFSADVLMTAPCVKHAPEQPNVVRCDARILQVHLLLSQDDKFAPTDAAPGIKAMILIEQPLGSKRLVRSETGIQGHQITGFPASRFPVAEQYCTCPHALAVPPYRGLGACVRSLLTRPDPN